MFLMRLEIDKLEWQQKPVAENQWENEDENDEFDSEYEIKLEEVEDVREILFFLCNGLEESNLVRFQVEGFGDSPWPVDIEADFEIVLEQLPQLLKFLDTTASSTADLDFYEQGIERQLVFTKTGDLIKINCQPLPVANRLNEPPQDDWGQDIEEVPIESASLKNMICNLIRNFVLIANELYPEWTDHELFQEWCREQNISSYLQN
jgi:hypothetical protein